MSKVVIELDETEEKTDLDIYIHRYEILGALREMSFAGQYIKVGIISVKYW